MGGICDNKDNLVLGKHYPRSFSDEGMIINNTYESSGSVGRSIFLNLSLCVCLCVCLSVSVSLMIRIDC